MMRTILIGLMAITLLFGVSLEASAYDGSAFYDWGPGVPNYNLSAVINNGTIGTADLFFGDFLGISATQPNALGWGDSGTIVNWADYWWIYWAGDGNTNGDALDGKWVHIIYPTEGWWDLGFETDKVVVFLSQDHGPYLGEGLEARVYGSNTLWGPVSSQAVLTDVYLDGWRPHNPAEDIDNNGWSSDDIAGVYELPGMYRYIKIAAWSDGSVDSYNEPEVDAVAGVITVIQVVVDIKPGSFPNSINLGSKGNVPVAILSDSAFDATTVDRSTVVFAGVSPLSIGKSPEDVNGDGLLDVILHFSTQSLNLQPSDIEACLTGKTLGGQDFEGCDSVRIVK
ncbi:MAG: hypothetical protein AB1478_06460 [Nitrospirota bacterium]